MINSLSNKVKEAILDLYNEDISPDKIQVEKTNREFEGDYTLVVFPLLRISRKPPQQTAEEIGNYLKERLTEIENFDIIKGFLNIKIKDRFWLNFFIDKLQDKNFGKTEAGRTDPVVVEFSSPNTNKPLHLGHIRNNLLGFSISRILEANGKRVVKINLVNDRGIHICKSMLAWMKWGKGETPQSSDMKGDHLVGKYYVMFEKKNRKQIEELVHQGRTEEDASKNTPLIREAQELLQKWEKADEDTLTVWHMMNGWAYDGFNQTYNRLGVEFDQINYESNTYLEGKQIVLKGVIDGVFYKKEDGSVWVDLSSENLDEKLLLRKDGTSVYITQDIGTAQRRYDEYSPQKLLYVVGNEQIYHFDVLKKIMSKLERPWANIIHHLSYGMVELPHGRMKSREGKVVDADELMDEMFETARKTTEELGKTEGFKKDDLGKLYNILSLGALKYFILKVDPKKNMLFNPEESIDFNGNTGPFIQYTYARIQSIFRKSDKKPEDLIPLVDPDKVKLIPIERELIKLLYEYPEIIKNAATNYNPAVIANYSFELARFFNHYYQDTPILMRVEEEVSSFRLLISWFCSRVIASSMNLLGIEVPSKM